MEEVPEMNVHEIYLKLQGDWADWDDKEDPILHIRKIELMHAINKMEGELSRCHEKIAEMIATKEELKDTHWACGHQGPGPGDEFVGPDYRDTCLLDMKLQLLKLSRLLSDNDLRKAYKTPPYLLDRVDLG